VHDDSKDIENIGTNGLGTEKVANKGMPSCKTKEIAHTCRYTSGYLIQN